MDRPDETRRVMNFKRLALTDHKLDVPRLAKKKAIIKALETNGEQLQTCRASAPLQQGALMPCHRVGGRTFSQALQCMLVQHLQSAANRRQAHCQQNKSGASAVGRACSRLGPGQLHRQVGFSLGQMQHLAGRRSLADDATRLQ